ncbi:hydroxymethylbilane synthase [Gryllotalpicola ginsengisoli]|uniref:hydroxymethylbilane synthase n=1 Tax=Gryllotalpicola ginsengisoli TaxID=444608 RepID=UPI0003B587E9|nr:hydroxymethylbilane synthase [Gryllotalpicola ginsengisoli]
MAGTLRVGTRGSALALAQTQQIAKALGRAAGLEIELVTVTTQGDTSTANLASLGGTGVFASALREALVAGEVDVVVHSLKDLPTAPYPGLKIGAIPKRADARDVLVARDGLTLAELPAGAVVGTGSPRRIAELRAARPDLEVAPDLRGNIDTRMGKVAAGELDAVILAAAGIDRLGKADAVSERFALADWPTAPGQGALALEVRTDAASDGSRADVRRALLKALDAVDHATTHANVVAERAVLAGLEAGCAAPVATSAIVDDGMLFLTASVYALDGSRKLTANHATVLDSTSKFDLLAGADEVAQRAVDELLAAGAKELA